MEQTLSKKRKPPISNGKVKIHDTKTGKVYPSNNNVYQSLLKAGELKELVDKGVLGDVPEKNTFVWYVIARERRGRLESLRLSTNLSEYKPGNMDQCDGQNTCNCEHLTFNQGVTG